MSRGAFSKNLVFTNAAGDEVRLCPSCGEERRVKDEWGTFTNPSGRRSLNAKCRVCEAVRAQSYRDSCDQEELRRREADRQRQRRARTRAASTIRKRRTYKAHRYVEYIIDEYDEKGEWTGFQYVVAGSNCKEVAQKLAAQWTAQPLTEEQRRELTR